MDHAAYHDRTSALVGVEGAFEAHEVCAFIHYVRIVLATSKVLSNGEEVFRIKSGKKRRHDIPAFLSTVGGEACYERHDVKTGAL